MKIFDIDYLATADLSDEDLHFLFDWNAISYSFIYYMLKLSGLKCGKTKFKNIVRNNHNWMNENILPKQQINETKDKFTKCIMNIYQYNKITAKRWVDDWYLYYGLPSRVISESF